MFAVFWVIPLPACPLAEVPKAIDWLTPCNCWTALTFPSPPILDKALIIARLGKDGESHRDGGRRLNIAWPGHDLQALWTMAWKRWHLAIHACRKCWLCREFPIYRRIARWQWAPIIQGSGVVRAMRRKMCSEAPKKKGQTPLPERPGGCFAQRGLSPFFFRSLSMSKHRHDTTPERWFVDLWRLCGCCGAAVGVCRLRPRLACCGVAGFCQHAGESTVRRRLFFRRTNRGTGTRNRGWRRGHRLLDLGSVADNWLDDRRLPPDQQAASGPWLWRVGR